jgi:hypothetical protein
MRCFGSASVDEEQEEVAAELRRVREEARAARVSGHAPPELAPVLQPPRRCDPLPPRGAALTPVEALPSLPDAAAVNAAWPAMGTPPRGVFALVHRLVARLLRVHLEAQRAFNGHQVRLDNELLRYVDERFAATHRHYDRLLGLQGGRLDDVDERHILLERELLAHVRDLVHRIDLVLAESGRGRASVEFVLEDLRARLARLEEARQRRS